ncbi:MAG: hypothetical protein OEL81_01510 [Nitrosopumilus sp.]|nr:hypothetical protein [Nitrosopumilus sp.]
MKKEFRDFEDARKFIGSLKLKSTKEWKQYCKSGNKPEDIPSNPNATYKNEWKGYVDWLGKSFLSFNDAKKYVQKLRLKSYTEWTEFRKSGNKPEDIPSAPAQVYKEWTNWGDFLGTGNIAPQNMQFLSYEDAKKIIIRYKIHTGKEYRNLAKAGKLPKGIPRDPRKSYKKEFSSWGEFLGTGKIANQNREFLSYKEAKKQIQKLKVSTLRQWQKKVKEGSIPKNIPTLPPRKYKKEWISWGDFLGTQNKAPRDIDYLPFDQAKKLYQKIAKENNIKTLIQWEEYLKTHKLPQNLPRQPQTAYSQENIVRKNEKRI